MIPFPSTYPEPAMTDHQTALVLPTDTEVERLAEDVKTARSYASKSLSEATRAAYRSDITVFERWCDARSISALPASPEVVASFAASQAKRNNPAKPSA